MFKTSICMIKKKYIKQNLQVKPVRHQQICLTSWNFSRLMKTLKVTLHYIENDVKNNRSYLCHY